jgi:hypothetical protein
MVPVGPLLPPLAMPITTSTTRIHGHSGVVYTSLAGTAVVDACTAAGSSGAVACGVPKIRFEASIRWFLIRSGCASVLIDQSTEDSVASDRGVTGDRRSEVAGWWVLIQALMRAVVIEMAHIPVKNNSGVSLVVDQQSVGAFRADAATNRSA